MPLPAGYRTLGQSLWMEMRDSIHGVLSSQEEQANKLSFEGWINAYNPRYEWYEFNRRLAKLLQAVADGLITRLMVYVPPRHGKSELISRLFSAYYLYRHPERWVGLCSYGDTLASTLSRAARANFKSGGGEIRTDSKAVTHWETTAGGGMWSSGVGGGITGKGFHLGIVDDPVKDAAQAASEVIQKRNIEWWQTTFYTRRNPGAAIIVVQTRWNELDLSGWLLKQEYDSRKPERWRVVAWEAIKEPERSPEEAEADMALLSSLRGVDAKKIQQRANYLWPSTVHLEDDWRAPGEALCPERYTVDDLEATKANMSNYFWAALYQQRPRPREGMLFKIEHFPIVDPATLPRMLVRVRFWDYASTEEDGDYTAGVLIGMGKDGFVYILHMVRGQWESAKRDDIIDSYRKADGAGTYVGREKEPGSAGKDAVYAFHNRLLGAQTFTKPATGSKFDRADPLAAAAQGGRVRVVQGPWNAEFIDEMVAFGSGTAHDDVADAAAGAYNEGMVRLRILRAQHEDTGSGTIQTL